MKNSFSLAITMTFFVLTSFLNAQNLIDTSVWNPNQPVTNQGSFNWHGAESINAVVNGQNPFNVISPLWQVNGGIDYSGFSTSTIALDTNKTYRISAWFKVNNGTNRNTAIRLWSSPGNTLQATNGNPSSSFYFTNWSLPSNDTWYLLVGFLKSTTDTNSYVGGIYQIGDVSGQPINGFNSDEVSMIAGLTGVAFRTFFSENNGSTQLVFDPRVEEITPGNNNVDDLLNSNTPTIAVNGVTSSPSTTSTEVGGNTNLTATVLPSNATNQNVSWSSANSTIASVSQNGLVTGVGIGSTTVTVTTADGGFSASTTITVNDNTTSNPTNPNASKLNLVGLSAEQSTSNYSSSQASVAIDGNTNGSNQDMVTHTQNEPNGWWRVDLGANYDLSRINIYNRTDCCTNRIIDTKVYVGSIDSYDPSDYQQVGNSLVDVGMQQLDFNATGRYIMVSQHDKSDADFLSLAEVEAYGTLSTDPDGGNGGGNDNPDASSLWSTSGNNIHFSSGKVGIGTTCPGNYELAVNGEIRAKEIKVETANWPDYVFKKGYQLPTLEEIQQHIEEKGYLPNMPSAKEVEANGVELGEMNRLLLEKIEELTLYILKQETRIINLENRVKLD